MSKLIAYAAIIAVMTCVIVFAKLVHTVCFTVMYFIRKDECIRKTASDATDAVNQTKEDK